MAKIIEATCTDAGHEVSTDYGDRVVADFESGENDDISVWEDQGSPSGNALLNTVEGHKYTLVRDKGKNGHYYKLEEGQQEDLLNGSAPQKTKTATRSPNGGDAPSKKEVAREILSDAEHVVGLQVEVYTALRDGFQEKGVDLPPPKAMAALTNTCIIQVSRNS